MMYEYLDGSANKYVIKKDSLEYVPIKPEISSSGEYDGGEPIKMALNEEQYALIVSILNKAMSNEASHIENRVMMSGLIIQKEGDEKKKCILSPKSDEKSEIERVLKQIMI